MLKNKNVYIFGEFSLDPQTRHLSRQNERVRLGTHAFEILLFLIEKRGMLVEKDELLSKIWRGAFVEESNLAVHIHELRRILGEKPGENKFIATVSGRGYCFVAPVRESEPNRSSFVDEHSGNRKPKENARKIYSLAVLPFTGNNLPQSLEYLSDGITDSLIRDLSQLPQLKVFSRSAVFQYKNQNLILQKIGFLLGAQAILTGHISLVNEQLRISVELINSFDQSHIWGAEYSFGADDLFKIKSDISLAIAEKLQVTLSEIDNLETKLRQTKNSEAYHLYLKGRYLLSKKTKEGFFKGIEFFQKALKIDPNYALAYSGVTDAYFGLYVWYHLPAADTILKAKSALERALILDDSLSEAWASKGQIQYRYEFDWEGAEKSFKRAIALNPNNSIALSLYSACLCYWGRFEESIALQYSALELDPFSISVNFTLSNRFFIAGEYGKAITVAEEVLEAEPNAIYVLAQIANSYTKLGFYDLALDHIERLLSSHPVPEIIASHAWIYAMSGNHDKAREILKKLLYTCPENLTDPCDIGAIYAALNEKKKAFSYLEKSIETRSPSSCAIKVEPRLEHLRTEPEFKVLVERIGLNPSY